MDATQPKEDEFYSRATPPPTEPQPVQPQRLSQDPICEDILECSALSKIMPEGKPAECLRRAMLPTQSTPSPSTSTSTLVSEEPVRFILLAQGTHKSTSEDELPATALFGRDQHGEPEELDALPPLPSQTTAGVGNDTETCTHASDDYKFIQPLKTFIAVANTISKQDHPYTKIVLGTLTDAAQAIITQTNLDKFVRAPGLLPKIGRVYSFLLEDSTLDNIGASKDILAQLARVITVCAQFTKSYGETQKLWNRLGRDVKSETQTAVGHYCKALDDLMQQYRDRSTEEPNVNIYRVLDDLSVDNVPYAGGAGLNTTKRCLDDTRKEILSEIVSWINDSDPNVPRVFWLHSLAGKGKSAIAHTIASWAENVGALGSCYCFDRDRVAERRTEKMMTTIARDMADRDPTWRQALADTITKDYLLPTSPDIMRQWERLILEPLSHVSGGVVGKVVLVIDGLDESSPDSSRNQILSVLMSAQTINLPSNFRIFVTSRPMPDIHLVLDNVLHVKSVSLDDVPIKFAERDIRSFISKEIGHLDGIGELEVNHIVRDAGGLFEWARLACKFVRTYRAGETPKERFNDLVDEQGGMLLDDMYGTILDATISKTPESLARFRSAMYVVLSAAEESLPLDAIEVRFPHKANHRELAAIVMSMAPLLTGVPYRSAPVLPIHRSFYDFLTDQSRSGEYFVNDDDIPEDADDYSTGTPLQEEWLDACAVPEERPIDLPLDVESPWDRGPFNSMAPSQSENKPPDHQHFLRRLKQVTTSRRDSHRPRLAQGRERNPNLDEDPAGGGINENSDPFVADARLRSTLAVATKDPPTKQKSQTMKMLNGQLVPVDDPRMEASAGNSSTSSSTGSRAESPPSQTRSDSDSLEVTCGCRNLVRMFSWW